jgi:hypothetical protein
MAITLKQGLILKSSDGEYVYNIFNFHDDEDMMTVDVLNRNLESLASRQWSKENFQKQIDNGTIVEFKEGEIIGE